MSPDRVRYLIDNFAATPEELSVLGTEGFSDTAFYIQLLKLRGRKYEGNGIPMYDGQTSREFRKRKEILEAIHYEELILAEDRCQDSM